MIKLKRFRHFCRWMRGEPSRVVYDIYIRSPAWKVKAEACKNAAGRRCQVCNVSEHASTLDAHHRTYERLGAELPGDLTCLCRECHGLYHGNE